MSNDSEIVIEVEAEAESAIIEAPLSSACTEQQKLVSEVTPSYEKSQKITKVKLDKFLWAARFFKTRALAKAAIERGKVFLNNTSSKPSVEVSIGDELYIRQGKFEKQIVITGLSTRRRSLEEASELYKEIISLNKPKISAYHSKRQSSTNHPYRHLQGAQPYNPNNPNSHNNSSEPHLAHNQYQAAQYKYAKQQQAKRSSRFLRRSVMKGSVSQNDNIVYADLERPNDNKSDN